MINLIASTLIQRPVKQVFDFVSKPENDYQWQYGTLATATLPKGSNAMQTFFRSIGHLMGRRNLSIFEVTDYELNEKYGFKSISGPVHSRTAYILENVSGGTRIHIFIQASAPHFFQVTEMLLGKIMKKQLDENVGTLKTILEENSTALWHQQDDVQSNDQADVMEEAAS